MVTLWCWSVYCCGNHHCCLVQFIIAIKQNHRWRRAIVIFLLNFYLQHNFIPENGHKSSPSGWRHFHWPIKLKTILPSSFSFTKCKNLEWAKILENRLHTLTGNKIKLTDSHDNVWNIYPEQYQLSVKICLYSSKNKLTSYII